MLRKRFLPRCVFHDPCFNGQLVLVVCGLSANDTPSPHFGERHSVSTLRVSTVGAANQTACMPRDSQVPMPDAMDGAQDHCFTITAPHVYPAHVDRYRDHSFRRYTLRRDIHAAPLSAGRHTPTAREIRVSRPDGLMCKEEASLVVDCRLRSRHGRSHSMLLSRFLRTSFRVTREAHLCASS